ncbi:MAG: hypothetical protein VXW11_03595, partial [Pseudomonadota bacterium]|nr:hypothetical protein [Pseudomonadota bacterium]
SSAPDGYSTLTDLPMGSSRSVELMRLKQTQEIELAKSITESAPLTIKATLTGIRRLRAATPLPDDHDLITMCFGSADFKEGVSAFFEKRPADWSGS